MSPPRDRTRLVLAALTLLALGLRLWIAWTHNQQVPDTPARLVGDEGGYDYLAWSLFEGRFFDWPGRTPVYPLFLAAVYAVAGHSFAAVVYVQAVLGAAAVPLTWRLARRFTTPWPAVVAAGIVAVHLPLALQVRRLYTETLFTLLLLLAVLALLAALERPSARRFVGAGAVLGVLNLCRPTAALLPLLLPLLLPKAVPPAGRARLTAAYLGGMLLLIAPWTWHNWRTHHAFLPLSVSVGALWQGSPEFHHLTEERGRSLLDVWAVELNPERNGGHDPFSIEGDRWFTRRAVASIRAEPLLWVRYSLQKAAYFWIGTPAVDWPFGRFFSWTTLRRWFSWWETAGMFYSRLLPVVALFALIRLRRRRREFLPLVAIGLYFMLVHAVTYPEIRYSEPLHPLLAVIIAAALPRREHEPPPTPAPTA